VPVTCAEGISKRRPTKKAKPASISSSPLLYCICMAANTSATPAPSQAGCACSDDAAPVGTDVDEDVDVDVDEEDDPDVDVAVPLRDTVVWLPVWVDTGVLAVVELLCDSVTNVVAVGAAAGVTSLATPLPGLKTGPGDQAVAAASETTDRAERRAADFMLKVVEWCVCRLLCDMWSGVYSSEMAQNGCV